MSFHSLPGHIGEAMDDAMDLADSDLLSLSGYHGSFPDMDMLLDDSIHIPPELAGDLLGSLNQNLALVAPSLNFPNPSPSLTPTGTSANLTSSLWNLSLSCHNTSSHATENLHGMHDGDSSLVSQNSSLSPTSPTVSPLSSSPSSTTHFDSSNQRCSSSEDSENCSTDTGMEADSSSSSASLIRGSNEVRRTFSPRAPHPINSGTPFRQFKSTSEKSSNISSPERAARDHLSASKSNASTSSGNISSQAAIFSSSSPESKSNARTIASTRSSKQDEEVSSEGGSYKHPMEQFGRLRKIQKKRALFDLVSLYDGCEWIDDVHFRAPEIEWDMKTMNNWGFFRNTSLGPSIYYHCWVIPMQGPIFRKGNLTQARELFPAPGSPRLPPGLSVVNGRPKLRVPEWRQKHGIAHLHVRGREPKFVGSTKRRRLLEEEEEGGREFDIKEDEDLLSITSLFDPIGIAYRQNRVTIIGVGFHCGPLQIFFGSTDYPARINFISEKGDVVVCQTPEHEPGKVWVEAVNGRGSARYEVQPYEFIQETTINSQQLVNQWANALEDNPQKSEYPSYGMHSAAAFGNNDLLQELVLSKRSDQINVMDDLGATPLFWASWAGRADTVALLLELGADPNISTCDGETPLHVAADIGSLDCINLLLDHGISINAVNVDGDSSLHYGCHHSKVIQLLQNRGADISIANSRGEKFRDWTPLGILLRSEIRKKVAHATTLAQRLVVTERERTRFEEFLNASDRPSRDSPRPTAPAVSRYCKVKPPKRRPPTRIDASTQLAEQRSKLVADGRI